MNTRTDSFVVETNVHYPTDINLLWDAIRKIIKLIAQLCNENGMSDWRQYRYNLRQIKHAFRQTQLAKRGGGKNKEQRVMDAHIAYLKVVQEYLLRAQHTCAELKLAKFCTDTIEEFIVHAKRQIDQIQRRVTKGETIPHDEKVFSLFQPHTKWVSKGKAGVPVELGLPVCIVEDQNQFILHHQVMEEGTDSAIAVEMIREAKRLFPNVSSGSFDKGFHSPANQEELSKILNKVIMPKKGHVSKERSKIERSDEFIKMRHKHSAVESAINCLEHHGLDICLDHGIERFKKYVAIAVCARNIQRIGNIIRQKIEKKINKQQQHLKLAA